MAWVCLAIGIALGAAAGAIATVWTARRLWRNARRMAARSKGREKLLELGQLAGGLAHEIKNPLSTVQVNLQLLGEDMARQGDELHQRWLRRLRNVQSETNRLKDILEDFLRYAGRYDLSPENADLRQVIDELTDFFTPQTESARVVLRTSLPEEPVPCRIDVKLIKQAMLNLMINGVQAMPDGGELLIRLGIQRDQAVVEVIDTGSGIDAEGLRRIFQVYYSTKKGGSGLGLPTTRRIIHEHHGAIRADSEVGKGTRFVISLPLSEDP